MKKTRIYVDTSVIGGCCDPEFQEWSCGLLTDFKSGVYSLFLSGLTDAEVQELQKRLQKVQRSTLDNTAQTTKAQT
ncbi:MAG: hypothetical protein Q8Q49_01655 [bacterium]|nr:hypothetical protein [bacterium]